MNPSRKLGRFLFLCRYCLRHPEFLTTYIRRWHILERLDKRFKPEEMRLFSDECRAFYRGIARKMERFPYLGSMDPRKYELIYAITRMIRPGRVVETGVAAGVSSAIILQALRRNGFGHLTSIDAGLANFDGITLTVPTGFFVPEECKGRWTLRTGLADEELPKLLSDESHIDLFLHDSDHGYSNMSWELEFAWQVLPESGLLIADNVELNSAFKDFVERIGCPAAMIHGLGVAVKPS